jgi:hypothetical protein
MWTSTLRASYWLEAGIGPTAAGANKGTAPTEQEAETRQMETGRASAIYVFPPAPFESVLSELCISVADPVSLPPLGLAQEGGVVEQAGDEAARQGANPVNAPVRPVGGRQCRAESAGRIQGSAGKGAGDEDTQRDR